MGYFLVSFAAILLLIVIIYFLNEKIFHLSNDIALVCGSLLIFAIIKGVCVLWFPESEFYLALRTFSFDEFLFNGILCFMIFAGASKVNFNHFIHNLKNIGLLSIVSTLITSLIYGLLFYLLNLALHLGFTLPLCILLGTIIAPTDPIAAISILKKVGLSKNVTSIIEGESLFNDGIGVVLYLIFKNIVSMSESQNIALLITKEILGAVVVGFVLSFILMQVLKHTNNSNTHIFISLLDVTLAYAICEYCGFSGVIASVICGIYFSHELAKEKDWLKVVDKDKQYERFWDNIDTILNSVLFILIGYSVIYLNNTSYLLLLILIPLLINLLSRLIGLLIASMANFKKMPNSYSRFEYCGLLTWGGLKGGLSLALVLQTKSFLPATTFNILLLVVFSTIIFTIIIQGLSIGGIYKRIENHKYRRIIKERTQ